MVKFTTFLPLLLGLVVSIIAALFLFELFHKHTVQNTTIIYRDTSIITHRDSSRAPYQPTPITFVLPSPTNPPQPKVTVVYVKGQSYPITIRPTDTAAIVKDYFTKYGYPDTLRLKQGYVALMDTIYRNGIFTRKWNSVITDTSYRVTTVITPIRTQVWAGLNVGTLNHGLMIEPDGGFNLALKTKKDRMYELKYSQGIQGTKEINLSAKFLIKARLPWKTGL